MKKFFTGMLALAAMAIFAPAASAQDEEPMMQFYVHGQPVKSGDRIDITPFFEEALLQYDAGLTCVTSASDEMVVTLDFYKDETSPALDADWLYGAKATAQICWPVQCQLVPSGKSLTVSGDTEPDVENKMLVHLGVGLGEEEEFKNVTVKSEFSITAEFAEEEVVLVFYVDKKAGEDAAVEGIDVDSDAIPVYYDLQGRQVQNPANGLYIVKTGSKVSKTFIR